MHGSASLLASWIPGGVRMTKNANTLLSTHIKQLLLLTFCDMIAGIGSVKGQEEWTDGKTDKRKG